MEKVRRLERLVALTKMLSDHPGRLFPLNQFGEMFGSAKSTLSEDMVSIREALGHFGLGTLETVAGAAGGSAGASRRSGKAVEYRRSSRAAQGRAARPRNRIRDPT